MTYGHVSTLGGVYSPTVEVKDFQKRLGEILAAERDARGLSQADLAERTQPTTPDDKPIHAMTISAIERGAAGDTKILTLFRIVEALDKFSLSELFLQIEGLKPQEEIRKDSLRQPSTSNPLEASHGRPVPSPDALALAELRKLLLGFSNFLANAAGDIPEAHRPDAATRAEQPGEDENSPAVDRHVPKQ